MKTLSSPTPITLLPNTQRNSNKVCPDLLRMEALGCGVGSTGTCRQQGNKSFQANLKAEAKISLLQVWPLPYITHTHK